MKDVIGDLGIWKWPANLCESILFQLERPSSFVCTAYCRAQAVYRKPGGLHMDSPLISFTCCVILLCKVLIFT